MATAVHAPFAHDATALAVAALRTKWLIPNPTQSPSTPHGLILSSVWASADTSEPRKERKPRKTEEQLAKVREIGMQYIAAKKKVSK